MKRALLIPMAGVTIVTISSCGDFATSLNNKNFNPENNPLDSPGRRSSTETVDLGPEFTPGSWVEVTDANAGIYRKIPRPSSAEQPDYRLRLGTPLKVVGSQGTYVKVETDSGQIGYVPAIMVGTKPTGAEIPLVSPDPLELPPAPIDPIDPLGPGGLEPLPDLGLAPIPTPGSGDAPFVAPEPEVPPISVEESPDPPKPGVPPKPVVPPDPVGNP
jgi:hypothetical protein